MTPYHKLVYDYARLLKEGRSYPLGTFKPAPRPEIPADAPTENVDAKDRLQELLEQMPASELINLSLSDLARKAQCTPRHLGRLFREELGMSFRAKQSKIRLERACELLATTESKIVDVALESGYQSLSLFNLIFKRSYGVSPGKWRASNQVTTA